jgi:hypothetical protein
MIPHRILSAIVMTGVASLGLSMQQRPPASPAIGHYLFAWTGDPMQGGKDFLAVIDADPASSTYIPAFRATRVNPVHALRTN